MLINTDISHKASAEEKKKVFYSVLKIINNAGDELKAGLITISEFYKIVHKIDIKHNLLYFKILDNLLKIRNKGVLNNEKSL